ncbi:hypothetical protein [Patulibacter minatonensis]|uniref:hypothetical protein n=1 Tax=Patulibacter minatonensis TaxID=298163 RepID=UPI00047ECC43|nr:hypothetical protein [Patulibacter minatonensis]
MTAPPTPSRTRPSRRPLHGVPALALVACAVGLTACGGGDGELKDASGGQPFAVSAQATFAKDQKLANVETLTVTVKNADQRALPDVAVTLGGLNRSIAVADNGAGRVADPRRPIWVVDEPPKGGTTAYVGTWALGRLAPGASKTFTWKLTPAVAGSHAVRWRVSAGLDENGPVRAASGGSTSGTLDTVVSDD